MDCIIVLFSIIIGVSLENLMQLSDMWYSPPLYNYRGGYGGPVETGGPYVPGSLKDYVSGLDWLT